MGFKEGSLDPLLMTSKHICAKSQPEIEMCVKTGNGEAVVQGTGWYEVLGGVRRNGFLVLKPR